MTQTSSLRHTQPDMQPEEACEIRNNPPLWSSWTHSLNVIKWTLISIAVRFYSFQHLQLPGRLEVGLFQNSFSTSTKQNFISLELWQIFSFAALWLSRRISSLTSESGCPFSCFTVLLDLCLPKLSLLQTSQRKKAIILPHVRIWRDSQGFCHSIVNLCHFVGGYHTERP